MAVIRGASDLNIHVDGIQDLEAQFRRIGNMKKKYLTKAARAGADNSLRAARASVHTGKTGMMKKGLHKSMESKNKRNKAVYRIKWNPKYTSDYLKPSSGAYGGKPPVAYYPHAVEYGHLKKNGRVQGKYWVAKGLKSVQANSAQKVVNSLKDSIDEIVRGV